MGDVLIFYGLQIEQRLYPFDFATLSDSAFVFEFFMVEQLILW